MALHVSRELYKDDLPEDCILDCSCPGDVLWAVREWRKRLDFTVHRANATACLEGYGAWEDEELLNMPDEELAEKILWLACGNFNEGDDVFVME